MRKVYMMRAGTLKMLIKSGRANCNRCGIKFAVGDRVTSRTGTANRYHERCLEETRI